MTESVFQYHMPTRVLHGPGSLARLGAEARMLGAKHVFLVSDPGVEKAGLLREALELLAAEGLAYTVWAEVPEDPDIATIEAGRQRLEGCGANLIVAIGGGSPLCAAKDVAIVATNGGSIADYEGAGKVKVRPLPVIAVPTTAGSGTEVSAVTLAADPVRHVKMPIASPLNYPPVAILDPRLLLTLPRRQLGISGIDALCHAIEAYLTTQATPLTDALAWNAVRLLARHMRLAAETHDLEALDACLLGSTIANMACGNARLGLVHALSWPVACLFGTPHGLDNGIFLPYALEFTRPAAVPRFAELAEAMGEPVHGRPAEEAATMFVRAVKRLLADFDFPRRLDPDRVRREAIPQMVAMLGQGIYSLFVRVNLRPASPEELAELYERAFEGWEMD